MSAVSALQCLGTQVCAHARGPVLTQVDAVVRPGRLTAILGPNGAGKSTLMAALVGLNQPCGGQVLLDGQCLTTWPAAQLARRLSFMAQDTQVAFAFQVREVVEMGRYPHRLQPDPQEAEIVRQAMHCTGVAHLAQREVSTLSGGERARVHLARALAQVWHPLSTAGHVRWLLLDEPTAALDLQHQHHIMQLLRGYADAGLGIVAVLHDLNLALRYADDVLLVPGAGAAAVHGSVQEILNPMRIRQIWAVQAETVRSCDGVMQYLFSKKGVDDETPRSNQ